jgi:hypothetical protein
MTAMHEITKESPFYEINSNNAKASIIGLMVCIQGTDVLTRAVITREHFYAVADLKFDCVFREFMTYQEENSLPVAHLTKLDTVISIDSLGKQEPTFPEEV